MNNEPALYALLIGIDDYDDRYVNGISYPKLTGAVRDINHVYTYLREQRNVPDDHIIRLTAPRVEPTGVWPTYPNLVAAFQQLLALARGPGDQVYIHYSGHGGRAATKFPKTKGAGTYDEALVPVDIGDPSGQYLRDVEINGLLKQLVDKGLAVTVVFDCCHSGGATRGELREPAPIPDGAVPRGIGMTDTGPRPHVSALADIAAAESLWPAANDESSPASRGVRQDAGWFFDTDDFTILAACRASELAYEYPFNGLESSGALTYYLLKTLRQSKPDLSYRQLMKRVEGQVHGIFKTQTPLPQGNADRRIFSREPIPGVYGVTVLEASPTGPVRLQAGGIHGLAPGALFNLFPFDADLTDLDERVAVVEVTHVQNAEGTGKIVDLIDPPHVEAGNVAVLVGPVNPKARRPVQVALDNPALRSAIESAIDQQGEGHIVVAQPGELPHFQILPGNNSNSYAICDPAGIPLALVPTAAVNDAESPARTVERLVHLAKFRSVEELRAPNSTASGNLTVEFVNPP